VAPFCLAFERGTANAEVALCTAKTANSFTVTRGFDGTTAVAHNVGTVVEHCSVALDYTEANAHTNLAHLSPTTIDAAGDLIVGTSDNTVDRLAADASPNKALITDPSLPKKLKYAEIGMGAWVPYTPTWTASASGTPLVGNGRLAGRYRQVGKTVDFYCALVLGSTSYGAYGIWGFSLPGGQVSTTLPGGDPQWTQAYVNKQDQAVAATGLLTGTVIFVLCGRASPSSVNNSWVQSSGPSWPSNWIAGDALRIWGTVEVV